MNITHAYAAQDAKAKLARSIISRANCALMMQIEVLYCGVCHSDLHRARNEWRNTVFPVVPAMKSWSRYRRWRARTNIKWAIWSASAVWSTPAAAAQAVRKDSSSTVKTALLAHGGIVKPAPSPTAATPPAWWLMLCATRTGKPRSGGRCAAAVRRYHHLFPAASLECRSRQKVGIVGLGGLGHMGVKIAHAMGAHVVLFTTSPSKLKTANASALTKW